jgi:hypothetical protein
VYVFKQLINVYHSHAFNLKPMSRDPFKLGFHIHLNDF